jgi:hypothetical protein
MNVDQLCTLAWRIFHNSTTSLSLEELTEVLRGPIDPYIFFHYVPKIGTELPFYLPLWHVRKMRFTVPEIFAVYAYNTFMGQRDCYRTDHEKLANWVSRLGLDIIPKKMDSPYHILDRALPYGTAAVIGKVKFSDISDRRWFYRLVCAGNENIPRAGKLIEEFLCGTIYTNNTVSARYETFDTVNRRQPHRIETSSSSEGEAGSAPTNLVARYRENYRGNAGADHSWFKPREPTAEEKRASEVTRKNAREQNYLLNLTHMEIYDAEDPNLAWKNVLSIHLDQAGIPANIVEALRRGAILAGGSCVELYYNYRVDRDPKVSDYDLYCTGTFEDVEGIDDAILDGNYVRARVPSGHNAYGAMRLISYAKLPRKVASAAGNGKHYARKIYNNLPTRRDVEAGNDLHAEYRENATRAPDGSYVFRAHSQYLNPKPILEDLEAAQRALEAPLGSAEFIVGHSERIIGTYSIPASKPKDAPKYDIDLICVEGDPREFVRREFDLNVCKIYAQIEGSDLKFYALHPEDLKSRTVKFSFHKEMTINSSKASTIVERRQKYVRKYKMTIARGSTMILTKYTRRYQDPMSERTIAYEGSSKMTFRGADRIFARSLESGNGVDYKLGMIKLFADEFITARPLGLRNAAAVANKCRWPSLNKATSEFATPPPSDVPVHTDRRGDPYGPLNLGPDPLPFVAYFPTNGSVSRLVQYYKLDFKMSHEIMKSSAVFAIKDYNFNRPCISRPKPWAATFEKPGSATNADPAQTHRSRKPRRTLENPFTARAEEARALQVRPGAHIVFHAPVTSQPAAPSYATFGVNIGYADPNVNATANIGYANILPL